MNTISGTALSGMKAAQALLDASANNIANAGTPGYRRQEVVQRSQADGGVATSVVQTRAQGPAMEADVVSQLQAKNQFLANLAVFKTSNKMTGALLDKTA
jgi:flagellar hook-associated protein FlgK